MRIYVRDIGEHRCGGLQVDCNIRTRNKSKVGGESRDGVQRKMKGSYGYSVSRNTRNPVAGKAGGSFKELRGFRGPRVVGSTEATTARESLLRFRFDAGGREGLSGGSCVFV